MRRRTGFTLLELVISLALVVALLSILLPTLASARVQSTREQCQENLRHCGAAWTMYLEDHAGEFPYVPTQPATKKICTALAYIHIHCQM